MTSPKSKLNPSADRDAMTVGDTRLIASELRHCVKGIRAGLTVIDLPSGARPGADCIEKQCRTLEITAQAMEQWATKVAMRRGDSAPPTPGAEPPRDPSQNDSAWQSTGYNVKRMEAGNRATESNG